MFLLFVIWLLIVIWLSVATKGVFAIFYFGSLTLAVVLGGIDGLLYFAYYSWLGVLVFICLWLGAVALGIMDGLSARLHYAKARRLP
jgi:hypothetical protein